MNKRTILVVAEDLEPGGATVVLHRILKLLQSRGDRVLCITGCDLRSSDALAGVERDDDAAKQGWGLKGRMREVLPARRLLRRYRPDLVIVNATSPGFMYAMMMQNIPVLYHLHPPIGVGGSAARKLVYPLVRRSGKRIVAVSEWHRSNVVEQWGVSNDGVSVLPNFPDRVVQMNANRDVILTVGRFHWSKDPVTWLSTGRRLLPELQERGMDMIWCAPMQTEETRKMTNPLPAGMKVVYGLTQGEVNGLFARTAVYYQPSMVEPQGIAVLEAMQNGIPCVVTGNSGMTDAVADEVHGIHVPSQDDNAHASAIASLLLDPQLSARLGSAAKRTIAERYTPSTWEKAFGELLTQVLP